MDWINWTLLKWPMLFGPNLHKLAAHLHIAMTMATLGHFGGRRCVVDAKSSTLTVRLTDDDNYMLKSASSASSASLRPRSASLSSAPSCRRQRETIPPAAALFNSAVVLQQVAASAASPASPASFICSCVPGCCCKCCLLSNVVAECQAVYHHVCARVTSTSPTSPTSTELTTANGCSGLPSDADQLPPPTVPQDVVSLPIVSIELIIN